MQKQLKVGIAGYGIVGKRRNHFIEQNPSLKTVAVCDKKFEPSNNHLNNDIKCFNNYRDLLAQDLDMIFICMTNDIAPEVTIAALKKGLHVFCEKPPGKDLYDISEVRKVSEQLPHLKLKYGFNHRYHESVSEAMEIIKSNELGKVINLRGIYGKSKIISFDNASVWRSQRDIAGGGILLDQGIHMVDLLRLFAGEFVDVHSFISNDFWKHDVEDNAYALMRTKDKKVAMLHSTATQWRHRFDLNISLEKGSITLSGILSGTKSYGAETMSVAWAASSDTGDPKEQVTRYNKDNSWKLEIDEFVSAVLHGTPILHGTVIDAYNTMKLVYDIYCADTEWKNRWGLKSTEDENNKIMQEI